MDLLHCEFWHIHCTGCALPNGMRLSCGAKRECSQTKDYNRKRGAGSFRRVLGSVKRMSAFQVLTETNAVSVAILNVKIAATIGLVADITRDLHAPRLKLS